MILRIETHCKTKSQNKAQVNPSKPQVNHKKNTGIVDQTKVCIRNAVNIEKYDPFLIRKKCLNITNIQSVHCVKNC